MKRNKPLCKRRKAGTQAERRRRAGWSWQDWQRQAADWTVFVPQSVVGTDAKVFDMTGATPFGIDEVPGDPTFQHGMNRWRLDIDGKSVVVYTSWRWGSSGALPRTGDVWYAFTSKGKCLRDNCQMTWFDYADNGSEIPHHRPGACPLGIPLDASWKYARRVTL